MFYKMPKEVYNFIFNYFTQTLNLPVNFQQIQTILNKIELIEEGKKEEKAPPAK